MESVATNSSESLGWMERLITELSSEMIRVPFEELTAAIDDALRRVGEELEVDRVALIQIVDDTSIAKVSEWLNPALPFPVDADSEPFKDLIQSPPIADTPIVLDRIDPLLTGVTSGLSDGYDSPSPLKSAVVVPVTIPDALRCALAVAVVHGYRSWPEIIVERLRLVAEILTTAWHRHTQELALRQSRSELARLATRLDRDTHETAKPPKVVPSFEEIVGDSRALHAALERLQEVAAGDTTVLLLGETGTGKELFARALHARSPRRPFPMISVNCAALPPTLIESELFGHERGAFTGAMTQRQGRFELAHRGTLFLDEIGDLPLDLQAKLLRVLQEGEFERLGASHSRKVDVRIVAATHRDLDEEVREARFREDLYYRLNVFAIRLPPLRERRSDIPALVWFLIRKRQAEMHRWIKRIPDEILERLQQHSWPGNIRELENVVERALIHSTGDTLLLFDDDIQSPSDDSPSDTTLESVERSHIEEILRECGGRINGRGNAAERLGIVRTRATSASSREAMARLR